MLLGFTILQKDFAAVIIFWDIATTIFSVILLQRDPTVHIFAGELVIEPSDDSSDTIDVDSKEAKTKKKKKKKKKSKSKNRIAAKKSSTPLSSTTSLTTAKPSKKKTKSHKAGKDKKNAKKKKSGASVARGLVVPLSKKLHKALTEHEAKGDDESGEEGEEDTLDIIPGLAGMQSS